MANRKDLKRYDDAAMYCDVLNWQDIIDAMIREKYFFIFEFHSDKNYSNVNKEITEEIRCLRDSLTEGHTDERVARIHMVIKALEREKKRIDELR